MDDDWLVVMCNLRRVRQKWVRQRKVLGREVADDRTFGRLCVAAVHTVLLYGSETWVMSPHIGRTLGGFHYRVDHRLMGW